jgi:hypothetical protein
MKIMSPMNVEQKIYLNEAQHRRNYDYVLLYPIKSHDIESE